MQPLEIPLQVSGLGNAIGALTQTNGLLRQISQAQRLVDSTVGGIQRAAQAQASLIGNLPQLQAVAKAYQEIAAAQQAMGKGSGTGGGINWRSGTGEKQGVKLPTGPAQRLLQVPELRQAVKALPEGPQKLAVHEDLNRREFLDKRSVELSRRRLSQGDAALKGPGLLELFGQMNGLLANLRSGNIPGVAMGASRLFAALHEAPGGLNVAQKAGGGIAAALAKAQGGAGADAKEWASIRTIPPAALAAAAGLIAVAGTVAAFRQMLEQATATLSEFRNAQLQSGGSGRDVASLSAFGVPRGAIPGLARSFRERISVNGDPLAMASAHRAGISTQLPRAFGGTNEAGLVLQAMRYLRVVKEMQGPEAQLLEARRLELESLLPLVNVTKNVADGQERLARLTGRIYTSGQTQAAADLAAQQQRLGMTWEALNVTLAQPFIQDAADGIGTLADFIGGLARVANATGPVVRAMFDQLPGIGQLDAVMQFFAWVGRWTDQLLGKKDGSLSAVDAHTQAMRDHAEALRQNTGGGPRAQSALPEKLHGEALRKAMEAGALGGIGAFT